MDDKSEYIMALLHHTKRLKFIVESSILFFLYHAEVPLETAKEYLTTFASKQS